MFMQSIFEIAIYIYIYIKSINKNKNFDIIVTNIDR